MEGDRSIEDIKFPCSCFLSHTATQLIAYLNLKNQRKNTNKLKGNAYTNLKRKKHIHHIFYSAIFCQKFFKLFNYLFLIEKKTISTKKYTKFNYSREQKQQLCAKIFLKCFSIYSLIERS